MITNTKLSRAIAFALTGVTLSIGSVSSAVAEPMVSYNAFNHDRPTPNSLFSGGNGTDGWLRTTSTRFVPAGSSYGAGKQTNNNPLQHVDSGFNQGNEAVPWVGDDPRTDPHFNYAGTTVLHWSVKMGAGESVTVSKNDSFSRYGRTELSDGTVFNYADIDTAQGAWHDGKKKGWRHDTDIGLFKSSVTQQVNLSIASILSNGQVDQTPDYGLTVFEGMDTTTSDYNHHAVWHEYSPLFTDFVGNNELQITEENPIQGQGSGQGTGLEILILDDVVGNDATFLAEAGKIYTILLGGYQGGEWIETRDDYKLDISSVSAVPVPAAVWLFGSALLGLSGLQRRKR